MADLMRPGNPAGAAGAPSQADLLRAVLLAQLQRNMGGGPVTANQPATAPAPRGIPEGMGFGVPVPPTPAPSPGNFFDLPSDQQAAAAVASQAPNTGGINLSKVADVVGEFFTDRLPQTGSIVLPQDRPAMSDVERDALFGGPAPFPPAPQSGRPQPGMAYPQNVVAGLSGAPPTPAGFQGATLPPGQPRPTPAQAALPLVQAAPQGVGPLEQIDAWMAQEPGVTGVASRPNPAPPQTPPAQTAQPNNDLWMALLRGGLATMQAGGQNGATTLGAIGQGGLAGLDAYEQMQANRSQAEREAAKAAADQQFREQQLRIQGRQADASMMNAETNAGVQTGRLKLDAWKAANPEMNIITENGRVVGVNPITGATQNLADLSGMTTKQKMDAALEIAKLNATQKVPGTDPITGEPTGSAVETFDPNVYMREVAAQMQAMGLDAAPWQARQTERVNSAIDTIKARWTAEEKRMRNAGATPEQIEAQRQLYLQQAQDVRSRLLGA